MIYLVEHFFSIQGEGKHLGTPSIFFRFGGCNMQCVGFGTKIETPQGKTVVGCDTAYAVFRHEFSDTWQSITEAESLLDIIDAYALHYKADVVLTGGEPLIYAQDPVFVSFLESVVQRGHRVTFETNGTIEIDFKKFPIYKACTFALSVKLKNSAESYEKRINERAIRAISKEAQSTFFKFTVNAQSIEDTAKEIELIRTFAPDIAVYVMPLSASRASIEQACEAVIAFCKQEGYIYSDRLHIRIWDEIQGV